MVEEEGALATCGSRSKTFAQDSAEEQMLCHLQWKVKQQNVFKPINKSLSARYM